MAKVKIARGIQSAYNSIQNKDADTIYICTDTGNMYLGSKTLFESNAYIDSSISGKIVTFTTHGNNGTSGSDTLDLSTFQTSQEVQQAIAAAIATVYKPMGSKPNTFIQNVIASNTLLNADHVGEVYNINGDFTTTENFVEGSGKSYPSGTNVVVVQQTSGSSYVYKYDALAGSVNLSNYLQVVQNATAGNFAGLDANGNVTDSGYKPSDFKTKQTQYTPEASNTTGSAGGQYVEQVTQDTNGEITVTRKKLPDFQGSGSVGTASSDADAWKTVVHDASLSSGRVLSGNTKSIPAATSSNDGYMTSTQASKLDGITAGGEPNVLEAVKVSGSALTIDSTDKSVNIETGTAYNATTNKIATMSDISDAALAWGSF